MTTTRYWFGPTGPIAITRHASWTHATALPGTRELVTTRPAGGTTVPGATSSAGAAPTMFVQGVSAADLPAGIIAGSLRAVLTPTQVYAPTTHAYARLVVRVVSADGTVVRGTLFSGSASIENASPSTNYRTRLIEGPLTPVVALAGDRLVVEEGVTSSLSPGVNWSAFDFTNIDAPYISDVAVANTPIWLEIIKTDPPNPPTSLTQLDATENSVTIGWSESFGGSPPTGYEIDFDGSVVPVPTGIGMYVQGGLTPSTTYPVRIRAVNDAGESVWVGPVMMTTDDGPPPPVPPDPLDSLGGTCNTEWRIEALDLVTGERKRILKPVSINFEEVLNEVGNASLTLNIKDVTMNDVWPHTTKIAFLRIAGPGATPSSPVCEFVGLVEAVASESGGTMTLGLKSIEEYLAHRYIRVDTSFVSEDQTEIGAFLVLGANTGGVFGLAGIPLYGIATPSGFVRDRQYLADDRKTILEAIHELTEIADGPDYVLTHSPDGSQSFMTFYGEAGGAAVLNAKRGIISYSLDVSAEKHANRIVGLGDSDLNTVVAAIPTGHPAWERVENYSDVKALSEVEENAQGSLANDKSPAATPQVTIAGLDLIAPLSLGDTVTLTMGNGALQYKGTSRIVGISWSSDEGSPTTATLTFTPGTAGVDSVLNAPVSNSGCCGGPV